MSHTKIKMKDAWSASPGYRTNYQTADQISQILELLELKSATRFLDNACGNGAIAIRAAQENPNLKVWAYDGLETAITECRKNGAQQMGKNLESGVAWADDLPLSENAVDRILFRNALHHISDSSALYAELGRLLAPAGILVLQAPCNNQEESFSTFLTELHLMMDDSHTRYYHQPQKIFDGLGEVGIVCETPICEKYHFPSIDGRQKILIADNGFTERLCLKQIAEKKWSIELDQIRVIGRRCKS